MQIYKIQNDNQFGTASIPSGTQLLFMGYNGSLSSVGLKTINSNHEVQTLVTPELRDNWNQKVSAPSGILPGLDGSNLLNVKPISQRIDLSRWY